MKPHFKSAGNEVLLLPLLAPKANLHLGLLRDGVIYGADWGVPSATIERWKVQELPDQIQEYGDWVREWYETGLSEVKVPNNDPHKTKVWEARNIFTRQMTLDVLDHAFYWPYYDPSSPDNNVPKLTRTIYSDPYGTADNSQFNVDNQPIAKITQIGIWGGSLIDAIQVKYGGTWGPRMGNSTGGTTNPPQGLNNVIHDNNSLIKVSGRSGDVLQAMQLFFKNGEVTNMCGGAVGGSDFSTGPFDGHIISSIKIMGKSNSYNCADCLVVGFRYEDSY